MNIECSFYEWIIESTNEIIFLLMNSLVCSRWECLTCFDCYCDPGTHITSDVCRGTHVPSDVCSSPQERHVTNICDVPYPGNTYPL